MTITTLEVGGAAADSDIRAKTNELAAAANTVTDGSALAKCRTLEVATGTKAAAATAGAATLNKAAGKITSEALTTAAGAEYVLTLTNSEVTAADILLASVANGTNTQGDPVIGRVKPGDATSTIRVVNRHATEALNGTLVISLLSIKA